MHSPVFRRLPLEGALNTRDLGGYPTADGRVTKFGRFLRSASPGKLTADDIRTLKELGVRMSVDLRGPGEVEESPSRLCGVPGVEYLNISAFDPAKYDPNAPESRSFSLKDLYRMLLDNCAPFFQKVLSAMAAADGAVIFNCTAGKDRTGVISAMLLTIAGVSESDILADYAVSEIYVREVLSDMPFEDDAHRYMSSSPDILESLLRRADEKYGGIYAYLTYAGVLERELEAIQRRFLD